MQNENNISTMHVTRSIALSGQKEGGLICIKGAHIGILIPLESDKKLILGRDSTQCDYVIKDSQISRKHLEITYLGAMNKYKIVDLSTNGVFMGDGSRLQKMKEYYLSPSDEIYIGNENNLYKLR